MQCMSQLNLHAVKIQAMHVVVSLPVVTIMKAAQTEKLVT